MCVFSFFSIFFCRSAMLSVQTSTNDVAVTCPLPSPPPPDIPPAQQSKAQVGKDDKMNGCETTRAFHLPALQRRPKTENAREKHAFTRVYACDVGRDSSGSQLEFVRSSIVKFFVDSAGEEVTLKLRFRNAGGDRVSRDEGEPSTRNPR